MTFFYDLNKRLKDVLEAPKSVHQTLNERDMSRAAKGKDLDPIRAKYDKYDNKKDVEEGLGSIVKKIGGGMKKAAGKALDTLGHGSDEDMIKKLQREIGATGAQVHGKKSMAMSNKVKEEYGPLEEKAAKPDGNRKESMKKAAADKKKGMTEDSENARGQVLLPASEWLKDPRLETQVMSLKVTGINVTDPAKGFHGDDGNDREYPGKYSWLVSTKAKNPMYFKDFLNMVMKMKKNPDAEVIGQMQSGPAPAVAEDWDTMMKDVERRRSEVKPGHKVAGAKGDIEKTATGVRHTRRYDPKTGETETGDEVGVDGQPAKRGRGRPKGSTGKIGAKGPSGTSKLMTREGEDSDIEAAKALLKKAGYKVSKGTEELDEKAVGQNQAVAARIARGVQKGEAEAKPGSASAEMAKMKPTELKKFAKTDTKDLPKKVKAKDEVEETTVSGSVAPAAEAPKAKGKGGMTFGKGIYDSMNRELESMIAESMNVSMNISNDAHGGPSKSLTVTATDDDAEMLGKLLKMAGLGSSAGGCGCGTSPCSCNSAERVEENSPDWPTDDVVTGDDDDHMTRWAGGLNKPKTTVAGDGQTTVPVTAVQVKEESDEELDEQEQVMAPESQDQKLDEKQDLGKAEKRTASEWLRDPRLETQVVSLMTTGINVTDPAKGFEGGDGNDREYPGKYQFLLTTTAKNPMYFKDFLNMVMKMKKDPNVEVIGRVQAEQPELAEELQRMRELAGINQHNRLDEGVMDTIKSLVPKAMKLLSGDTAAQIAQQVKQATGGDFTPSRENAIKVAKALGFEEILKNKIGQEPQAQVAEAWGIAGNWQGKMIQLLYSVIPAAAVASMAGLGPGGILQWWLGTVGLFLLTFVDTFFSTDRGMVGAMGRHGNQGFDTKKGPNSLGEDDLDRMMEIAGVQKVKEDDMEEGNRFLYNLQKAREAGKKEADLDGDGDLEKVRESINSMWKAYKG